MKNKTVKVLGAAAVIAAGGAVVTPAMADPIPPAASYADLLQPIPNAMERLNSADAEDQNQPARLQDVQYYRSYGRDHHHHHHHHHHSRRWYYQNGYFWNGGGWARRPVHHHHHHHHHHHND